MAATRVKETNVLPKLSLGDTLNTVWYSQRHLFKLFLITTTIDLINGGTNSMTKVQERV